MRKKMVLASASPRRRQLLAQVGLEFTVLPSDIEENPVSTLPQDVVIELSKEKARDVWGKLDQYDRDAVENDRDAHGSEVHDISAVEKANRMTDEVDCRMPGKDEKAVRKDRKELLVLSADTVVSIEGEILGKPKDEEDAVRMLSLLSGKEHQVYTGITMIWIDEMGKEEEYSFFVCTSVVMYHMSKTDIEAYVYSGEPMDKAGAYGVQGRAAAYIKAIRGEYSNVVGLPVGRLCQEMKAWDLL